MSMRKLRGIVEGPYGRWVMLGLLLFILVIFTVTDEMTRWLRGLGGGNGQILGTDVAGSFSVLKGSKTDVTWTEFDHARGRYRLILRLRGDTSDASELEVWTHLILLQAARREGITVSDENVARIMQAVVRPNIWENRKRYNEWVRENFRVDAADLEEALREFMMTSRLREVYQESFEVAPPTSREEAITSFASQNVEYARGTAAVLPAARFLQDAEDEFAAREDPDAALKEFFENDPDVKAEDDAFRNPRRYQLEVLYTIHRKLTPENYKRIEALFHRTYPDLDLAKLEVPIKDQRDFYSLYRDRLLEEAGTSYTEVREKELAERKAKGEPDPGAKDGDPGAKEGDEPGDEGEPGNPDGDPAKGDGDGEPKSPEDQAKEEALDPKALRDALFDKGFGIVQDQVDRELRLRGMFEWFSTEAHKAGDKTSLKALFDVLAKHDDKENPVCSTEPGKGLIVYRDFGGQYLSGDDLENIEDDGVKFTHNFRFRVNQIGETDLPKLNHKTDVLGFTGHGRQLVRLLDVKRPSRKTFAELSEGEKADLKDEWYLPAQARRMARERLEVLRKNILGGDVKPDDLPAEARALGCRVHENEWYEASHGVPAEPDKSLYWPDAYLAMRDRAFLLRELTSVLRRDRIKKELKPGSIPDILVESRRDKDDPGAAYLFLLLERREPDASTIPNDDMNEYMNYARFSKRNEVTDRWERNPKKLLEDFDVVFSSEMDKRVKEELRKREEAKKRARS